MQVYPQTTRIDENSIVKRTNFEKVLKSSMRFNKQKAFKNSKDWLHKMDKALEPLDDLDCTEDFEEGSSFHSSRGPSSKTVTKALYW